jgi:hypothetical protein
MTTRDPGPAREISVVPANGLGAARSRRGAGVSSAPVSVEATFTVALALFEKRIGDAVLPERTTNLAPEFSAKGQDGTVAFEAVRTNA